MLLYHSRMRSADKNKTVCGGVFTAYVPIGFLTADSISSDAVQIVPNAALYHFGVLTSSMHMAWMRAVCGRLKSDYRYSKDIVYNNFPWPYQIDNGKLIIENELSEKQKLSILNYQLKRLPSPFLMSVQNNRTALLPTSTMKLPCPQTCAKPTRPTTRL